MPAILSMINESRSEDFERLPYEHVKLSHGQFVEYEDSQAQPAEGLFKHLRLRCVQESVEEIPSVLSIRGYFLDAFRRTYKAADVVLDRRRYLPIVALEIGSGVMLSPSG